MTVDTSQLNIFQATFGNAHQKIGTKGNPTLASPSHRNPTVTQNLFWSCSNTKRLILKGDIHSGRLWAQLRYEYNALLLVLFWMRGLYLGENISEACFFSTGLVLLCLFVVWVFPHGSSGEKACMLHRANCWASFTGRAVSTGQMIDKLVHSLWESFGVSPLLSCKCIHFEFYSSALFLWLFSTKWKIHSKLWQSA